MENRILTAKADDGDDDLGGAYAHFNISQHNSFHAYICLSCDAQRLFLEEMGLVMISSQT